MPAPVDELLINQGPQALLLRAALHPFSAQPGFVLRIAPDQMWDLALVAPTIIYDPIGSTPNALVAFGRCSLQADPRFCQGRPYLFRSCSATFPESPTSTAGVSKGESCTSRAGGGGKEYKACAQPWHITIGFVLSWGGGFWKNRQRPPRLPKRGPRCPAAPGRAELKLARHGGRDVAVPTRAVPA